MTQPNPSTALARVLIDELARHGVGFIVISPGSRSAALAIAAAEHPRVQTRVVIDERSAGFWALGRAKTTGSPAAVISTSGTAVANFLPAVVEADLALSPLILVTADRPAELRNVGANQTIDQVGLFGSKVRHTIDLAAPDAETDQNDYWRTSVSTAMAAALGSAGMPGPVHFNVSFREPTVPVSDDGRSRAAPYRFSTEGRDDGDPWLEPGVAPPPTGSLEMAGSSRGMIVAGEGAYDVEGVRDSARAVGWPVLATALSGLRGQEVVSSYHHLLSEGVPLGLRPEVVVSIGAIGPSQRLEDLIAEARLRFRVDPQGRTFDPGLNATRVVHADPVSILDHLVVDGPDEAWIESWYRLDRSVRSEIDEYLDTLPSPAGASVARALNGAPWKTLVAASSLPIREIDAHLVRGGRVLANRGASGIDGFVSTALGVASAEPATLALAGDLSLLHDSNGFLADETGDLVVVVLDNDGGGLFDSLPQAIHAPQYERLFVTPHGRDLGQLAALDGVGYAEIESVSWLPALVEERFGEGGAHLIRVPIDRRNDLEVRRTLDGIGAKVARSAEL